MVEALILSRLKRGVDTAKSAGLGASAIFAALGAACLAAFPVQALATSASDAVAERHEPDPWPQVNIPAHSDYSEAKALLAKHKWEEAAIVLRSVLKRNPAFFPAAIELARALLYLGRREEALNLLAQAISRQPPGARKAALIARVGVLSRIFLAQKTFQLYQDGLNLLSQQKYRPARDRFEKALESEPDNIEVLVRIGQCLVLEGDVDSAGERLRLAKRLNPYEPEISLWLGRALHQRGELAQALEELRVAREGLAGSERAPVWYAHALLSAGNRKGAIQELEKDVDANPFHLAVMVTLARIRSESSREGLEPLWGARKELQVALSRLPQYESKEPNRSEGELGIEIKQPAATLKTEISALIAQLDGKLKEPGARPPGRVQR
jgi:tetratricopeptide (TPR) repeat protein